MERFDKLLEKDIEGYDGPHADLIHQAPAFYRLMSNLMSDRALPRKLWQLLIAAIAYFILPRDIIPEEVHGPAGYLDDIYLCALTADQVRQATGSDEILTRNWDGERPVMPLVQEILTREREIIGDKGKDILGYIGYDELVA